MLETLTHQARLNNLGVHIVVLWRVLHLENNLDEGPRKVLDEDDLREGGLQDRLEVALARSYIARQRVRSLLSLAKRHGAPTSNPCSRSYDDIDVCLVRVLVPPLGFDGPVDRRDHRVPGVGIFGRPIRSREHPKCSFWA